MLSPLLSLYLAFAPPDATYRQAVADLDSTLDALDTESKDLDESIRSIERAIERVAQYPADIPDDAHTQNRLAEARLSLAWLYLADGNEAAAAAAMDDAIRSAWGRGRPLRPGKFGPAVLRLYKDRAQALKAQGTATLAVDCGRRPCAVVVNEHRVTNPSGPLSLGRYRVWVGASEGVPAWQSFDVELSEPGETERIVYGRNAKAPGGSLERASKRKFMLPRWPGIVGLSAGAGLLVAGAVLGTVKPEAMTASYALIGSGAGVMALSGVTLIVHEVRVGKTKGQQAMLAWSFRF